MYITITLNPNDKLYNMNKSKLISLIYDFKNIYDIDVDLLLNSLNSECITNYIIDYKIETQIENEDIIIPKSIVFFVINNNICKIEFAYAQNNTYLENIISKLDTVCFENNHSICFGKNINNKSNIIKCFYQVLKKTINK